MAAHQQKKPRLILASASPRRRELLANAGFAFEVVPSGVEETIDSGTPPAEVARRNALRKAEAVARRMPHGRNDAVVLGADTIVVVGGEVLGKPRSTAEACAMLGKLSGRAHEVITGVALVAPGGGRRVVAHEITRVFFRPLGPAEIEAYVATGEPMDKAGAYAAQGGAARFLERVEGSYFNVVGLPVGLVERLLREWSEP